jgi:hypothetical protein
MTTRPSPPESPRRPAARGRRAPAGNSHRRRWLWPAAAVLGLLAAVTLVWFQPQKLLYDQRVSEGLPSATAPAGEVGTGAAAAARPVELAAGTFVSREHPTHGTARALRLPDGRVIVRFEDFATSNGPVLVVRLSTNPAEGAAGAFGDHYVNLGSLKGNVGDQNYLVPAGVAVGAYSSVVVWCARFSVPFGAADLTPSSPASGP